MIIEGKTFGDFYDEIAKTKIFEGKMWLEEWVETLDEGSWEPIRRLPLEAEQIITFAKDMVFLFRERMAAICTDALYSRTSKTGHEFLKEVQAVAQKFGVDVQAFVDVAITPSEAVARASRPST